MHENKRINRNPTIAYGSILQMFCVRYNDAMIMQTPLQVLQPLAADHDGDALNIMLILNRMLLYLYSGIQLSMLILCFIWVEFTIQMSSWQRLWL